MSRLASLALAAAAAASVGAGPAYANHIPAATYSGPAATGGTVSFDVSPDGTAVTRFAVTDVPTTCGTVSTTATGSFAITNHAFSFAPASGLRFAGTFPGIQQSQGTLSLRLLGYPSCTSADVSWTATTSTSPSGAAPPPAETGPAPDTIPPVAPLSGSRSQRLGGSVFVTAGCPVEACRATARGTLAVPGAARVFRLRAASAQVAAGASAKLKLKLTPTARRAAGRALAKGRRVVASLTVTATDQAGNRTVKRRTVRLHR